MDEGEVRIVVCVLSVENSEQDCSLKAEGSEEGGKGKLRGITTTIRQEPDHQHGKSIDATRLFVTRMYI